MNSWSFCYTLVYCCEIIKLKKIDIYGTSYAAYIFEGIRDE